MSSLDIRPAGPVLVLAPNGRDAAVIAQVLGQAHLASIACSDLPALVECLDTADPGAALIAQEALLPDAAPLRGWIAAQPPWSDFPFVLLTFRNAVGPTDLPTTRLASTLGNVTVLERPLHPVSLVSALGAALRARSRQRDTEALLIERDRHAAALRASEARFRAIVDGMPQPIWSSGPDGRPDFFNARWQEVAGLVPPLPDPTTTTPAAVFDWARLIHPDDLDRLRTEWLEAVHSGAPFRSEFRMSTRGGTWHWFTGRALPVHDDISGEIVRWFGSCTDIDAAVRAREALARGTEELERLVSQRTASLQREMLEREKAEAALAQAQKMEAVGQLTGGVAHDFNNLLTAVLGSLQMIAKRTEDPQIRRFADNARRAADRGARLTQQLLAFSRRQRLAPEAVNLHHLLSGIGDLLTRAVGATVSLQTRFAGELPPALVDPTQLELALLNLAINARDAMPDGGRLTLDNFALSSVPPDLAEDLAPGSYIAIAVTDTGAGMTPDVRERAFEPFFTTKEQGKGTGLGLSQVYGFVRQSGGTVKLRSAPGEGTTVTIYLPRSETLPEAEAPVPADQAQPAGHARILVVDDDDDVRDLVVAMLEELGYRVTSAENGYAALDLLLSDNEYDLLLADVAMPGLSGADVVRAAREAGRAPPVLYATGYADLGTYRTGLEGEDMIRKPYRMADLASRVELALLRASRLRDERESSDHVSDHVNSEEVIHSEVVLGSDSA
ncbi:MAG TPA: ATP-binding protein [Acetobacteraceae bacterium]|jgi:signal transduction histidine kinase/FixJ family two-component response regulator|nr:ATP-binding protein [Acetobacteraceae bacterium]